MAKCKYCGAEVTIGERCTYCGSKAEGCELVGDFIGAVSIFVFLFELYIIGVMLGGH